jgi:hypothetical protein
MLISARKILLLAMYCSLVSFPAIATAQDHPSHYMKGIKIISYLPAYVEKTVGGDGCKINEENLNTSLQFVANQSTNLKIVTETERHERGNELWAQASALSLSDPAHEAARKAARDYGFMPRFLIDIFPLQTQFECAGTIRAELSVRIEDAQLIPTQVPISGNGRKSVEYGFVAPQQSFSNQAINLAEQMMKRLVNDWTASQ